MAEGDLGVAADVSGGGVAACAAGLLPVAPGNAEGVAPVVAQAAAAAATIATHSRRTNVATDIADPNSL